jgi:hypothetical protein
MLHFLSVFNDSPIVHGSVGIAAPLTYRNRPNEAIKCGKGANRILINFFFSSRTACQFDSGPWHSRDCIPIFLQLLLTNLQ